MSLSAPAVFTFIERATVASASAAGAIASLSGVKQLNCRFAVRWASTRTAPLPWMSAARNGYHPFRAAHCRQYAAPPKAPPHVSEPPSCGSVKDLSSETQTSTPTHLPPTTRIRDSPASSPSSSSSTPSTNMGYQRVFLRMILTLGGCGFFTACGYLLYIAKVQQLALEQQSGKKSLLFPDGPSNTPKEEPTGLLSNIERMCETISDQLQYLLDKYIPLSAVPLLPDVADLNYPESLPTLVVDLDKVLVKMEHDRKSGWRVMKRPGADEFFKELVYHYELVVWSDDNFPVAQEVCGKWGVPVVGALHRDQCKRGRHGHYIKDLSRLGRRLERVIMLDHDPVAFSLQPENGILIREYNGDPNDTDLLALTEFLKVAALSPHSDIRDVVKEFGGGDVDLVKRWVVHRSEQEKKTESRRLLGSRLFGLSGSGSRPGTPRSLGWA